MAAAALHRRLEAAHVSHVVREAVGVGDAAAVFVAAVAVSRLELEQQRARPQEEPVPQPGAEHADEHVGGGEQCEQVPCARAAVSEGCGGAVRTRGAAVTNGSPGTAWRAPATPPAPWRSPCAAPGGGRRCARLNGAIATPPCSRKAAMIASALATSERALPPRSTHTPAGARRSAPAFAFAFTCTPTLSAPAESEAGGGAAKRGGGGAGRKPYSARMRRLLAAHTPR